MIDSKVCPFCRSDDKEKSVFDERKYVILCKTHGVVTDEQMIGESLRRQVRREDLERLREEMQKAFT